MAIVDPKTISLFAKDLYNIIADEDQINPGYISGSYTITDVVSKKKYIVETVCAGKDSESRELIGEFHSFYNVISGMDKCHFEFCS